MTSLKEIPRYIKLLRKYNKLETEYEVLKEYTKNHCFEMLLEKVSESDEIRRLKVENKKLRIKLKELKATFRR